MTKSRRSRPWLLRAAAVAALALALWPGSAAAQFRITPHLQDVRQDGITIVWALDAAASGLVTVDGRDFHSAGVDTHHEVRVTGLSPGTTYGYTVESGPAMTSGTFRTAPSDRLAPYRFIIYGDTRSNELDHQAVVDAMRDEGDLDFMIHTGDMISSGEIESDWLTFFEIEGPMLAEIPWYPVLGNHEEDDGTTPPWYYDFLAPPVDTSGVEEYYSFTYANSAFIILDGHVSVATRLFGLWYDFSATQLSWLADMLDDYSADPAIQHIFVFTHVPPYSSDGDRTGSRGVRLLHGDFLGAGVDAVFCGHDHYLERGSSPGGLRYYIIGGGGASLYENTSEGHLGFKWPRALPWLDDAHTVHFAMSTHGYAVVEIENGQVDVFIKDVGGAVLDTLSWNTGDLEPPVDPDGGPDGGLDAGLDAGRDGGADAGGPDADAGVPPVDAGPDTGPETGPSDADPSEPDAAADAGGTSRPSDAGGCGCRASSRQGLTLPAAALLTVLFWGWRRRR